MTTTPIPTSGVLHERVGHGHLAALVRALDSLVGDLDRLDAWGRRLASVLVCGGRLLAVGNGGSAAQAQHLTSELVGRYRDEREPMSAIAIHAETSALTAIANDYGIEEAFARPVRAHGRPGDVLVALSTSGRSPNVVAAIRAAREVGMTTWAMTGHGPNPMVQACDDALLADSPVTATVQEVHQVAIHLVCEAVDRELLALRAIGS
ncbi:MAG TPA: SIS domain-containing protein [Acidimicrobiia bacterium]|nr:SIS domain-containing protein [Acidimicrobiia bacterium]